MQENKLIRMLQSLSISEMRILKEFIISPYFNKNPLITQLISICITHISSQNTHLLTDEYVFSVLWEKEGFDKMKISRLRYKAFQVVEEFVLQQLLKTKKREMYMHLLAYYADNDLQDLHQDTRAKLFALQKEVVERDSTFYYEQFAIGEATLRFMVQTQQRNSSLDLHEVETHLNIFYISQKLALACNALSRQFVLHSAFQPDLLPEVLQYVENHPEILNHPPVKVYYTLFQMMQFPENENYFAEFQSLLNDYKQFFTEKESKNLHAYIRNRCISHINNGIISYLKVLFDVYDKHLHEGLLYDESGQLPSATFKNIVVLALRLHQFEWTDTFLQNFTNKLPFTEQSDTYNYCLAKRSFTQKDYAATLHLLQNVDFVDVFLNIAARKLLMQTYFERKEWEALQATINTFRVFIHRNKTLSEQHKQMNRNFANILFKIAENPHTFAQNKDKWTQLIESTSPISEKSWLLEKVQDFAG